MLNRRDPKSGVLVLIVCSIGLSILGIYALYTTPVFSLDAKVYTLALSEFAIQQIEHLVLPSSFLKQLPEFSAPAAEARWWEMQAPVYHLLQEKGSLSVVLREEDGVSKRIQGLVRPPLFLR